MPNSELFYHLYADFSSACTRMDRKYRPTVIPQAHELVELKAECASASAGSDTVNAREDAKNPTRGCYCCRASMK